MPNPTVVADPWVSVEGSVFKIGGVDYSGLCVGGGYKIATARDDMNPLSGQGWTQSARTLSTLTGTVIVGWQPGTAPVITEGATYAVVIDNPNGPYVAGNVSIDSGDYSLDPKLAAKTTFTLTSQGPMTKTRPGP